MKRIAVTLAFTILLGFLLSVFSGCSQQATADSVAFRLLNLYPSLPRCSQYVKDVEPFTVGYLSPKDFSFLYTGRRVMLPEWDGISAFRLILSDTVDFFEIHVVETVTTPDADEIAALLQRRADLLTYHNRVEPDYPAREAVVFRRGRFAILIATNDNEAALRLLDRIL